MRLGALIALAAACASAGLDAPGTAGQSPPASWSFVSNRGLHPARVTILANSPATAAGYIFLSPIGNVSRKHVPFYGQKGPLILDGDGNPVWERPMPPGQVAMDFRAQVYRGRPVLTWWQGTLPATGVGHGVEMIADDHYRTIAVLRPRPGWFIDPHELQLTSRGTALFTEERRVPHDLTRFGGPADGFVIDPVVVEESIETHRIVFTWDPLRHVKLRDSYTHPSGRTWDAFHVNSIDVEPSGNLLVSIKDMWTLYSVDRRTGRILWRLGGKRSDFTLGPGAHFAWQHDARFVAPNEITMFDNEDSPPHALQSRGLVLAVEVSARTARLLRQYTHPHPPLLTGSQGSLQLLPNGDAFISWGQMPYVSEFGPRGALLLDLKLPGRDETYRAFRLPWVGRPPGPPSLAVANGGATAYASWNGATQVARWQLMTGPSRQALAVSATVTRAGFETAIPIGSGSSYVQVKALDANGNVLGTSATVAR